MGSTNELFEDDLDAASSPRERLSTSDAQVWHNLLRVPHKGHDSNTEELSINLETSRLNKSKSLSRYLQEQINRRGSSKVDELAIDSLNLTLRQSVRPSFYCDSHTNVRDKVVGSAGSNSFLISAEPLGVPLDASHGAMRRSSSISSSFTLANRKEPQIESSLVLHSGSSFVESAIDINQLKQSSQKGGSTSSIKRTSSTLTKAVDVLNKTLKAPDNHYTESIKRRKKEIEAEKTNSSYDFLEKDKKIDQGSLLPNTKWWYGFFVFSVISLIACIVTLWAPYPIGARMLTDMVAEMPWSDGCKDNLDSCICPRETICADDVLSMILLTISRCSAWFDYPLYMCMFLSKCNNLNNYLQKTVLRCWVNFSDYHKVHRLFGIVVGVESASHSFFHLLRWSLRNDDIKLLWTNQTGITGMIALVSGAFVILPMSLPSLKSHMVYEWKKGLHYLAVVWAVGLMYHAPERIFWMVGVPFIVYLVDIIEIFARTFLIESAQFQRLGDSVCIVSFENPPGFGNHSSAYVYLMLPWISKYQFHAFTVSPGKVPNTSSICISKCGNWTEALMNEITTPTHKPAFVMGPFLSPFSSPAMDSENIVAVASGVGVTPALSILKKYSSTARKIGLVWVCRDPALVEHFLQSLELGYDSHTLIYYTGNRPLFLNVDFPSHITIFRGRPDLEKAISAIIYSSANNESLPEDLHSRNSVITRATPEQRVRLLIERTMSIYSIDHLFQYSASLASSHHQEVSNRPPGAVASFSAVLLMLDNLLGDLDEYREKLRDILELVDTYGESLLNQDMFEDFVHLIMHKDLFDGGTESTVDNTSNTSDEELCCLTKSYGNYRIETILQGEGKYSSQKWKMLYCGGSNAVLTQLKNYERKHSINLYVEKFDW